MSKGVLSFSRSGLKDWLLQRISAVVILVYSVCLMGFWLGHANANYVVWKDFLGSVPMRFLSLFMLLSLLVHAWIGLWIVSTDYIQCRVFRLTAQITFICLLLGYLVWGIRILWGV